MGDDRWRGGRPYDNRQSGHRQSGSRNMGGPRGNAWSDSRDQSPAGPANEQHVPVRGFNATEAKSALKRGAHEPKPAAYKPTGKDVNNRASGPWGAKPNNMASGKDFFLELRKQVTSLRGGNVPGG
ncbi:hypothetical protein SI65_05031 [Aspergillus cristatus]|uniref:Uncharacterized protein n=1 Tax=Aspergillus cristatus TaxID=573508 RepID=A0A1E3BGE0_ASPCR|nr:hypothetical protein SI65_05031 [Aspergillus cristatus]